MGEEEGDWWRVPEHSPSQEPRDPGKHVAGSENRHSLVPGSSDTPFGAPLSSQGLYSWAKVAAAKCHRLSSLKDRKLFSHNGGQKMETKELAGLVSSEAALLGWQMAAFLCPWCLSLFLQGHQSYGFRAPLQ